MTDEPDTCRPVELPDGTAIIVRGSGELTDQGREALAALVDAARRMAASEPPNPRQIAIDALAERLPDVPLHRRVAAANTVLRALDAAGMLAVTLDGHARAEQAAAEAAIAGARVICATLHASYAGMRPSLDLITQALDGAPNESEPK